MNYIILYYTCCFIIKMIELLNLCFNLSFIGEKNCGEIKGIVIFCTHIFHHPGDISSFNFKG